MEKKVKRKKKNIGGLIAIIILLLLISMGGIGIMAYPMISAIYAESVRSEVHTQYEEMVEDTNEEILNTIRVAAEEYNRKLFTGEISPLTPEENGYFEQLQLPDTNVMCYVSIPKINVTLPVYHGIGDDALGNGAGHMPQSSLPIGGKNSHSVISAHTGMAKSPMFSDLELMDVGDIFQIQVLGEILTYEVESIDVVLPYDVETVQIQSDRDLASLVTCTPYGINSHRLVVTGYRIETAAHKELQSQVVGTSEDNTESVWTTQYWNSVKIGAYIAIGIILLLILLLIARAIIRKIKKEKRRQIRNEQ